MSSNVPSTCSRCGVVSQHFIHNVPHRGTFHRFCTNCVLRLHSHAFCPVCFTLHPPHTHSLITHTSPSCFKCSSVPHSHCLGPTPKRAKTPSICPMCINPKTPPFILQDFKPIDSKSARVLLLAAKIVSGLMSKAVLEARVNVERRAMAALISRKKARIATQQFACVFAQAKLKRNLLNDHDHSKCEQCGSGGNEADLLLCDKCHRGFHFFCIRPILDSVPQGSWFCADCSAQFQINADFRMPNRMDLPDMAVDEELLMEGMLRNITETARAGRSDKAEVFKKKEKKQSTTERVFKSKLISEPEGEVEFGATGLEEEQMTENKEHPDGGIGGDRTEILLNGEDEENEEGDVDSDALKKLKDKRPVSPYKEKVGNGHWHKTHKGLSSERQKMSNKKATIVSEKSPFVHSYENADGDKGPRGRENWTPGPFLKSMASEDDMMKIMEGGWEDHAVTAENAQAREVSLVAGLVMRANDYRARCKKAEAALKVCDTQFDEMENKVKAAQRSFMDAKKQVDTAKKVAQILAEDMKDFENAAKKKKKEAKLRTRNEELEQELTILKKEVKRLTAKLAKQKDIAHSLSVKLHKCPLRHR